MYQTRSIQCEAAIVQLAGKEYMVAAIDGAAHVIDADAFGLLFEPSEPTRTSGPPEFRFAKRKPARRARKVAEPAAAAPPPETPGEAPVFRAVGGEESLASICWRLLDGEPRTISELAKGCAKQGRTVELNILAAILRKLVVKGFLEVEDTGNGMACYRRLR
jgi:hypothetical protein